MGTKIAAALDGIYLKSGIKVKTKDLGKHEKEIKSQRMSDGCFQIKYCGEDTIVTWGYGHICELKQAYDYDESYKDWRNIPLPYIPEKYELKLIKGNEAQYKKLKQFFGQSRLIISATDSDREGDLIFDYLYTYMHCNVPYKRALMNKQDEEEYIKAFKPENLVSSYDRRNVVAAGRGRSAGDFICGAGPTVAMTLKYGVQDVLSVGRVQTATLNMIVKREKEIINFKPEDYWVIKGTFTTNTGETYVGYHDAKKIMEKSKAEELLSKVKHQNSFVESIEVKESKKSRPHLYSLPMLQMDANKMYGYSLDETHTITDKLYNCGFVTYPRTDSAYLTEDMKPEVDTVMRMLAGTKYSVFIPEQPEQYYTKYYFDNSKVTSHYAIIPTKKVPNGLNTDEERIYDLIARSFLTMLYKDATLSKTTIITNVGGEHFITQGTSILDAGYMRVTGIPKEKTLPNVKENEAVGNECVIETKQTEPPKRYTAASLLNAMINCGKFIEDAELKKLMANGPDGKPRGLGRPSSQASIVKTLEERGYIITKNKTITPTKKGIAFIEALPVEDLKSAEMTARWEKRLDDIEAGKDTYESFMHDLEESVRRWTNQILESEDNKALLSTNQTFKCPMCKRDMVKLKWGYSCTGYKEETCNFAISTTICGKKLSDKNIEDLLTKGITSEIKGFVSPKDKKQKFNRKLVFNKQEGKIEFEKLAKPQESGMLCPCCNKKLIKFRWGYGCSGKAEGCKFSIGSIKGLQLTEFQVKELLAGKKIFLTGLKSSNGKYNVYISMVLEGDETGKLNWEFPKKGR